MNVFVLSLFLFHRVSLRTTGRRIDTLPSWPGCSHQTFTSAWCLGSSSSSSVTLCPGCSSTSCCAPEAWAAGRVWSDFTSEPVGSRLLSVLFRENQHFVCFSAQAAAQVCSLWLLNPLPMGVSSRGNAESVLAVLVLGTLLCKEGEALSCLRFLPKRIKAH